MMLALVAIGTAMSLLLLAAAVTDFNTTTPILAVMIGLGVAIDYSLFIVMRFRQELAKGRTPRRGRHHRRLHRRPRRRLRRRHRRDLDLRPRARRDPVRRQDGLRHRDRRDRRRLHRRDADAGPALQGRPPHRPPADAVGPQQREPRPDRGISRVARFVERRPKTVLFATLAVVLTMAIPVLSLNMGTADAGTNPPDTTTRKAYDLLAEGFGPGFNGPLLVAVDQGDDPEATQELAAAFAATDGVAAVAPPQENQAGDTAQIAVIPETAPQSSETADLVHTLRDDVIPATLEGSSATAHVGGETAANEDVASKIISSIPLFLAFVVGVIFLLMTMAFRSVVVALKAALDDPAVGPRRLRRPGRRLRVGLAPGPRRPGHHRPDRVLPAGDRAVDPVRPRDGLRGLPGLPHPRGVRQGRRRPRVRHPRREGRRPRHRGRRDHHGRRLLGLRAQRRPHRQVVRPRPRRGDPGGRPDHPAC